jgi:hypothetical protein
VWRQDGFEAHQDLLVSDRDLQEGCWWAIEDSDYSFRWWLDYSRREQARLSSP